MQQDKRSPDFSKIHPTAESFKAAKLWREKMSSSKRTGQSGHGSGN